MSTGNIMTNAIQCGVMARRRKRMKPKERARLGGLARARNLSPERRREIAALGNAARRKREDRNADTE
jgi:hypothetical protein